MVTIRTCTRSLRAHPHHADDPQGFRIHAAAIGIRDPTPDFCIIASDVPARVAAVFTRSRFAGPSVHLSRAAAADGIARALTVVSKNANVATGERGTRDAEEVQARVARMLAIDTEEVLIASTGVIGRPYPMDTIRAHLEQLTWPPLSCAGFDDAARAIMTTDTRAKIVRTRIGNASLVGIAKGVGMIEPNMATLLAFFFTDAQLGDQAAVGFRHVMDRTFNCLSIDTDTSTSDTAALMWNGLAGPCPQPEFDSALHGVALALVKLIARDGEGASKLLQVTVSGARDYLQAKRAAKAIVNSPLVKTAVYGADPNWGRVVMALGKCEDDTDIDPARVTVWLGPVELYPAPATAAALEAASAHLASPEVLIRADLGVGGAEATVYGCDLTEGYIGINAHYST